MLAKGLESIRNALFALKPESLTQVSDAIAAAARDEPELALEAFRDAARQIIATDPRAAETFNACAEILTSELKRRE